MKVKKAFISIFLIILIFFGFENPVHANLFTDDDDSSKIEDTIDKDEGRIIRENYCKNDTEVLLKRYLI